MQPKSRILITSFVILALLTLFAFSSPLSGGSLPPSTQEACSEKAGSCVSPEKKGGDDLMMENLSRQFIFINPSN